MTTPEGPMLEVVVPSEPVNHVALATLCLGVAGEAGIPERQLQVYGRPLTSRSLEIHLKGKRGFLIEGNGFQAHLACITHYRQGYLTVTGLGWGLLDTCARLVADVTLIVSCRWLSAEYHHWQNAEDPLLYRVAGRSVEGLRMKNNDLPPPLDQMIVDISGNPGRRVLRDGYVEAVGHKMWLGSEFFSRVPGVNRDVVVSAPWLRVSERPHGILEIVAGDEPFVDESTADLQVRLRRLLFPTTVDER